MGIICILIIVLVVLVLVASNFMIDFTLNPKAPFTMKSLIDSGKMKATFGMEDIDFHTEHAKQVSEWFDTKRESITLIAEDGTELYAWKVPNSETPSSHLYTIFCHGYTDEPAGITINAYHFYERGYNVVLPAARAHERNINTGLIQMGYQDSKDLVGWINQIAEADPEARIVLMGVSMGGAEVMMASGWNLPSNVACIVEDCGYSSVWNEFALQIQNLFHLPTFPMLNITSMVYKLRGGYDFKEASSTKQLAKASVPILFIHGSEDEFVPFADLQINYDACASKDKQMLVVKGAGHSISCLVNPELYWSTVDAFVDARV